MEIRVKVLFHAAPKFSETAMVSHFFFFFFGMPDAVVDIA